MMRKLDSKSENFQDTLHQLLAKGITISEDIASAVHPIIASVDSRGDDALIDWTRRLDDWQPEDAAALELTPLRRADISATTEPQVRQALEKAIVRIKRYAEHQRLRGWSETDADGMRFGERIEALEKVGLYVPGGLAAYPSSVLMNALPARVAGVRELIMCVPAPHGTINPAVITAAELADVDRIFLLGGAQAIAAMAFGTHSVPRVDKIVGPGNRYVQGAKKQLYGQVGIDMLAGPSEVVVLADASANPIWIAADLIAQAEHDPWAQAILISSDQTLIDQVEHHIKNEFPRQPRADIIEQSLRDRGALIKVRDEDEGAHMVDMIAPEHLVVMSTHASTWAQKVQHAGAIFIGGYSVQAFGDYCAGTNHVLPTAGAARFASPLNTADFQKRISFIECSQQAAQALSVIGSVLARSEGFEAHARAMECRFEHKHQPD